jgi:adenylate cyclase
MAVLVIAVVATALSVVASRAPLVGWWMWAVDDAFYNAAYRLRTPEKIDDSPVVVFEIDDRSLTEVAEATTFTWPWPRGYYGLAAKKLEEKGARVVVLDMILSERSREGTEDDEAMAEFVDSLTTTRFVGGVAGADGRFVPPVSQAIPLGDFEVDPTGAYRFYSPTAAHRDSLALAAIRAAGETSKLDTSKPFRLRYYGPHRDTEGMSPFPTYSVGTLINEIAFERGGTPLPEDKRVPASVVKDKIVLIGPLAKGLLDLKTTPVSDRYPGVEIHATAILNMLRGDRVVEVGTAVLVLVSLIASLVISACAIHFRAAWLKMAGITFVITALVLLSGVLMQTSQMRWLAPTVPLSAAIVACVGALVWVYKIEDARARMLLKVLSQCISPDVARDLAADPTPLTVGGQRREMTILFTDMQGFTDLTERLQERIEPVLNHYLAEMSKQAFERNGTIDKYIGDAMMVFWNAPLSQQDHARIACETALALVDHESRIKPALATLGCDKCFTRIGIHTGPVVVGFFGSKERLTYTAVGDSVNLAARLEPSNKIYGTQILVSHDTVRSCGDLMLFRPVDRLRVYGRNEAVGVYELMAERSRATPDQLWLADQSEAAGRAYLSRDWDGCVRIVEMILARFPDDGPAKMWRSRVETYRTSPPPESWDGVWEQTSK